MRLILHIIAVVGFFVGLCAGAVQLIEYACPKFGVACSLSSNPPSVERVLEPNTRSVDIRMSQEPETFVALRYRIASGLFGGERVEVLAVFDDAEFIVHSDSLDETRFIPGDADNLRAVSGVLVANRETDGRGSPDGVAAQILLVVADERVIRRHFLVESPSDRFLPADVDITNVSFSADERRLSFDLSSAASTVSIQGREVRLQPASSISSASRWADRVQIILSASFEVESVRTAAGLDRLAEIERLADQYNACLEEKPELFRASFPELDRGFVTCWTWTRFFTTDFRSGYTNPGTIVYSVADVRPDRAAIMIDRDAGAGLEHTGICPANMDSDAVIATGASGQWVVHGCRSEQQSRASDHERYTTTGYDVYFYFQRAGWADPTRHTIACDCNSLWLRGVRFDEERQELRFEVETDADQLVIDGVTHATGVMLASASESTRVRIDVTLGYSGTEPTVASVVRVAGLN